MGLDTKVPDGQITDLAGSRSKPWAEVSRHGAVVDGLDSSKQPRHFISIEELIRTSWGNVRKGPLVKQSRIHHALIGQMLDHHVDELDLCRRRDAFGEELAKGFADRRTFETDNRADEAAETMTRLEPA